MTIIQELGADKEIKELQEKLYETTGQRLLFNFDCYGGIEDYREHLRQCVQAGKIVQRPWDEEVYHRFDGIFTLDTTSH